MVSATSELTYNACTKRLLKRLREALFQYRPYPRLEIISGTAMLVLSIDLSQDNTSIAVPLMISSLGYGLYWNNASRSRFNNRFVHALYVSSEVADTIDYYFIYGPELDSVIAGYRELTGAAPMFGKWAYGFWQCKNRYKSQAELLAVAQKYRDLKIPIDNVVQDWFWWDRKGDHVFNQNDPDPKGMIDQLPR